MADRTTARYIPPSKEGGMYLETKVCTGCGVEKPAADYYPKKNGKYGVGARCKLCENKRDEERRRALGQKRRPRIEDGGRDCTRCGEWKVWEEFSLKSQKEDRKVNRQSTCKACVSVVNAERRKNSPEFRARQQRRQLERNGWTPEMKEVAISLQGGTCANPYCPDLPTDADHDHVTEEARGVLCSTCNRALGLLGDSSQRVEGLAIYARQCENAREWFLDTSPLQ